MKFISKIAIALFLTFSFFACSDNELTENISLTKEQAIKNLKDNLIDIKSKHSTSKNTSSRFPVDINGFVFEEEEKGQSLDNSIALLNSFGVTNQDIIEEFGSLENPDIITTALASSRIEEQSQLGYYVVDFETGYNYSTDSYVDLKGMNNTANSVVDCAMDALGIPAGLIVGSAKNLGRKALLKAARKLATRMLGWVGAGIAVYEFGDCMEWW
ncbi:MAG: hypothetical protein GW817_13880 [Flavobacteriales bacterium]|nr:hypothetical protein [Flavobacteriales bacterium]PIY09740.1 MAG: hypothetical protein COZ17_12085 [Flavobacteriaceae bacterium CG_4_10_14_3_um_filter_33_47]PJB17038.1 MAG: hypothetical protein CO117_13090 [Flavobacteriaceae bacterium CG_4_9_14_3_um_filter_33_16]